MHYQQFLGQLNYVECLKVHFQSKSRDYHRVTDINVALEPKLPNTGEDLTFSMMFGSEKHKCNIFGHFCISSIIRWTLLFV